MTVLSKLKVSLTKHGAHKVAQLLAQYKYENVLDHTQDNDLGIDIDRAQAKKTLSVVNGNVPDYWEDAVKLGTDAIEYAVAISIIFSHHRLIEVMQHNGVNGGGSVQRNQLSNDKEFTNFRDDIRELSLMRSSTRDEFNYSFKPAFEIKGFGSVILSILHSKLKLANWDQKNSVVEEAIRLNFHKVFSVKAEAFNDWMATGSLIKSDTSEEAVGEFKFKSGHNPSKTGSSIAKPAKRSKAVNLLHNELQTKLYDWLVLQHGRACVGTEVPTGIAETSVDIVVEDNGYITFYELKTSNEVRLAIREAFGQIVEYAYWPNVARANAIVIVAPASQSDASKDYIQQLQDKFNLPIQYKEIDIETGHLKD